jgi:hypothetical protein
MAALLSGMPTGAYAGARRTGTQDLAYDYRSLAITSVLNSAEEAVKLADIAERIELLVAGARVLPPSHRDDAIRLLDVCLRHLKDWAASEDSNYRQRRIAPALRNEILSAYAKLNPDRAATLQKEDQATNTPSDIEKSIRPNGGWTGSITQRRATADQSVNIALSIIDTDPKRALTLVVQSVREGIVSNSIPPLFDKLRKSDHLPLLIELQASLSHAVASTFTLDPFSLTCISVLLQSDGQHLSPTTRAGFIRFLVNSLETWARLVKGDDGSGGLDPSYVSSSFTVLFINVRPAIAQYAPEELIKIEILFDQVSPFVPEKTRSRLQALQPEKLPDPRDRLNDILKDANAESRDLRLIGLVAQLLRNESADVEKNLELAAEAVSGLSDTDTKSAFTDLLTITRINSFVKQKKFIEAQRLADSVSSKETRAWALLALSMVAAKADPVLGFELIRTAMKALDAASPSPHKVQLALAAAAMLVKSDPQRAFDTLSVAAKYANSSAAKVDPPTKPPVVFGLDSAIGEMHTKLGVSPEALADLRIDAALSELGRVDWFRANEIADGIREPALRLRLKLEFARTVIAQGDKPNQKQKPTKPISNVGPTITKKP